MTRRLLPLAVAAAGVLLLVPAPTAATPTAARAATQDVLVTEGGTRLALVSCALRNTGTGWHIIDDRGHTPSGCTSVVEHADHLELRHPVGAVRVSSVTVTVDETYARAGLRAGVSAGFDLSRIYLYTGSPGTPPFNPAAVAATTGNLWVQGYLRL